MTYAWPFEERGVWQAKKSFVLQMAQRLLPPKRCRDEQAVGERAAGVLSRQECALVFRAIGTRSVRCSAVTGRGTSDATLTVT